MVGLIVLLSGRHGAEGDFVAQRSDKVVGHRTQMPAALSNQQVPEPTLCSQSSEVLCLGAPPAPIAAPESPQAPVETPP